MREMRIVQIFKNFKVTGVLSITERVFVESNIRLCDKKLLEQWCMPFSINYKELLDWVEQFEEQGIDIPADLLNQLATILEKIVYLPATSQSMSQLLTVLEELRDFYNKNYVSLKGPRFVENLFKEIDEILANSVEQVGKIVSRSYNRIQRVRGTETVRIS